MCLEQKLSENFKETIDSYKDAFEVVHQRFELSKTLKIHVIVEHYGDYLEMTGTNFRETNGEHHEALHHTLKTLEYFFLYLREKKHGSPVHQLKSYKSIVIRNTLSAGFTPKLKLKI